MNKQLLWLLNEARWLLLYSCAVLGITLLYSEWFRDIDLHEITRSSYISALGGGLILWIFRLRDIKSAKKDVQTDI